MEPVGLTKNGKTTLYVHLQPRSTKNRVCGLHDNALKLAVAAPPIDGKANRQARAFLAELFAINRKDISLVSGAKSRRKCFCLSALSEDEVKDRLRRLLA